MEQSKNNRPISFIFIFFLFLTVFSPLVAQQQSFIKTIVVLGMENRSFDHMVGWMKKSINPSINGVTGDECNPISTKNPNPQSICFSDDAEFADPDLVTRSKPSSNRCSVQPHPLPCPASSSRRSPLFDRWFSSIPGLTQPNRLFVYSATSRGSTSHVKRQLAQGNLRKLKYVFKFHQLDFKFKKDARGRDTVRDCPKFGREHQPCSFVLQVRPARSSPVNYYGLSLDQERHRQVTPARSSRTNYYVISGPNGPTPSSEFEHSSIPATIKKMFNLSSNFLTHRDAWAGTFEGVVGELTTPRTDCPETLPDVVPPRTTEAKEDAGLSEFQSEIVHLATVLIGDHFLSSFPNEMSKKVTLKEAHEYTRGAVSRFISASKEAIKLGADKSAIVDTRSSLTTRSSNP
ncbi:hypothetical protein F3Y22_tig00009013pilonHSYRG00034 [Hibiscus syriacus]|uniref:Non-specific phospholipase C6 n=1 Tax=Hibiscus syriacus TaxID=106335 RepID=A0A6A3C734_HIBSY|nr:hypothetical protein F3Y22_tig00009013pilonHSYRG00034 [Hibiscus syriacus]